MNKEDQVENSILNLRLIRSFEHRNIRHIVLRDVDLTWKHSRFMEYVNNCKSSQASDVDRRRLQ